MRFQGKGKKLEEKKEKKEGLQVEMKKKKEEEEDEKEKGERSFGILFLLNPKKPSNFFTFFQILSSSVLSTFI